jgi:hypothetical protein
MEREYPIMINRFFKYADMGNATGFLYHDKNGGKWLGTAKHILFFQANNGHPYTRINVIFDRINPSICLFIGLSDIFKHTRIHTNEEIDIAMIRISQLLERRYAVRKEYSNFYFFTDATINNQKLREGDSVCVHGYPEKNSEDSTSLKKLRGKVITCPSEKLSPSLGYSFCIDQPVEKGMSGSPVIISNADESEALIVGVCIARLQNDKIAGAVQPSYFLRDIIDNGKSLPPRWRVAGS